jgi:cell division protein FtsI (penicillin-binding protein 3)
MAQNLKRSAKDARDSTSLLIPDVKGGNIEAANYILNGLGVKKKISTSQAKTSNSIIPNVIGMGARDAVYQLEARGVKAKIHGRGKVKSQSIYAGTAIKEGMICELYME